MKNAKTKVYEFFLGIIGFLLIVTMGLVGSSITAKAESSQEIEKVKTVSYSLYDHEDNSGYGFSEKEKVNKLSNGMTSLGTLTAKGEFTEKTFNGTDAFALNGKGITFSFIYQTEQRTDEYGHTWNVDNDSATSVAGYNVGTINGGAILISKSYDNKTYTKETHMTSLKNGQTITYNPSGEDIGKGVYIRFQVVAEYNYRYVSGSHKVWDFWPFKSHYENDYSNYYRNFGQMSTVFVANDTAEISIMNHGILDESSKEFDSETAELISHSSTISDGGVSFSAVKLDYLKNSSYSINLICNGAPCELKDGIVLNSVGKYDLTVTTLFETTKRTSFYIFDLGSDLGRSTYFGNGLINDEKRMVDNSLAVPVYYVGKSFHVNIGQNMPGLNGSLLYYKTLTDLDDGNGEEYKSFEDSKVIDVTLNKSGFYVFELCVGNPKLNNTDVVQYICPFFISSNSPLPAHNKMLLNDYSSMASYQRKVYTVTVQTSGGGNYLFTYPVICYDEAYSFAERVEKLAIEKYTEKGSVVYYYYDKNSNNKVKYSDIQKLYKVVAERAKANVRLDYIEGGVDYAVMNTNDIQDITKTSMPRDVRVVENESFRFALKTKDTYLNDFIFEQVASYESETVKVKNKATNEIISIPFGVEVDSILNKYGTANYTVIEKNWFGETCYEAIFVADSDNTASISFNVDGSKYSRNMSNKNSISGRTVSIIQGSDLYDSETIVRIHYLATDQYEYHLLSEVDNVEIISSAEVSVINRFGYDFSIGVEIVEPEPTTNTINKVEKENEVTFDSIGSSELDKPSDNIDDFNSGKVNDYEENGPSIIIKEPVPQEPKTENHLAQIIVIVVGSILVGITIFEAIYIAKKKFMKN